MLKIIVILYPSHYLCGVADVKAYIIEQVTKVIAKRGRRANVSDLIDPGDGEAIFKSLDITARGYITNKQYIESEY